MHKTESINVNAVFHIIFTMFSIHNHKLKCKLLARLRLKFLHIGNPKFCRKFKDCLRSNVTVVMKSKQLNPFFLRCQFLASERNNLHDELCLIDPPVISFNREPQFYYMVQMNLTAK